MPDDVTTSRVRTVLAPETVSGFIALVIEPDRATIVHAYELARRLMPPDAELVLAPGSLPHVTLTQGPARGVPRSRLAGFVARLESELDGLQLPLRSIAVVPGGFLFWCVDEASPERRALQRAHESVIPVADGLLDPVANAAVVDGTRRLTGNDPVLVANAVRYGYAFVRDAYRPHITLGFDPRLATGGSLRDYRDHRHSMAVARVSVVGLGRYGQVEHRYAF